MRLFICFLDQDFMLGLSARRTIAYSVNLCSQQFVDPDTPQGQELSYRLQVMNRRWEGVCAKAADWQKKLQVYIYFSCFLTIMFLFVWNNIHMWMESIWTLLEFMRRKRPNPIKTISDFLRKIWIWYEISLRDRIFSMSSGNLSHYDLIHHYENVLNLT